MPGVLLERNTSIWSEISPQVIKMKPPLSSGAPAEYVGERNSSLPTDVKGTAWVSREENDSSPSRRECSPTEWHLSDAQGTGFTAGDTQVPGAERCMLSEQEF